MNCKLKLLSKILERESVYRNGHQIGYIVAQADISNMLIGMSMPRKEALTLCYRHAFGRLDVWAQEEPTAMVTAPNPKIWEPESKYDQHPEPSDEQHIRALKNHLLTIEHLELRRFEHRYSYQVGYISAICDIAVLMLMMRIAPEKALGLCLEYASGRLHNWALEVPTEIALPPDLKMWQAVSKYDKSIEEFA
jgi:hypothetical protein